LPNRKRKFFSASAIASSSTESRSKQFRRVDDEWLGGTFGMPSHDTAAEDVIETRPDDSNRPRLAVDDPVIRDLRIDVQPYGSPLGIAELTLKQSGNALANPHSVLINGGREQSRGNLCRECELVVLP